MPNAIMVIFPYQNESTWVFDDAAAGLVMLTPNEKRVAEDRPDCYWLYVVTDGKTTPRLQDPVKDAVRLPWREVKKVAH